MIIRRLLEAVGRHGLRGAAVATLLWMLYGHQLGLIGDAFVAFADGYGEPAAIMGFAATSLYAMWGAMVIIESVILVIVLTVMLVRAAIETRRPRRTPS